MGRGVRAGGRPRERNGAKALSLLLIGSWRIVTLTAANAAVRRGHWLSGERGASARPRCGTLTGPRVGPPRREGGDRSMSQTIFAHELGSFPCCPHTGSPGGVPHPRGRRRRADRRGGRAARRARLPGRHRPRRRFPRSPPRAPRARLARGQRREPDRRDRRTGGARRRHRCLPRGPGERSVRVVVGGAAAPRGDGARRRGAGDQPRAAGAAAGSADRRPDAHGARARHARRRA